MSLLTFNASLDGIELQLRRIADALDRFNPPPREKDLNVRKRDRLIHYGKDKDVWAREEFANLIHPMGLAPADEQELIQESMEAFQLEAEASS